MPRRGRSTQEWRVLRAQCFERDRRNNARCEICKGALGPIDYSVKPSSTDAAWEPDHRIPVVARPELAEVPENIQASHRSCNRSKKNKAGINNLGNPSRVWK